MYGALFSLRCFDSQDSESPIFWVSFIVYGGSEEEIVAAGNDYFERYIHYKASTCKRVHKSGPHYVNPCLKTSGGIEEIIDWPKLVLRVEEQEPARIESNDACLFQTFSDPVVGEHSVALEELSPELRAELARQEKGPYPVAIQERISQELGFSLSKQTGNERTEPAFYFLTSFFDTGLHERAGELFLVAAPNLDMAADLGWELLGNPAGTIFTEWCYPIFSSNG